MSTNGYWAISLVLGLVVAVVAVVLLQLFLNQVKRIERGAEAVWESGKLVARNTATTWHHVRQARRVDGRGVAP
jgi:uncharacterized membrane protein